MQQKIFCKDINSASLFRIEVIALFILMKFCAPIRCVFVSRDPKSGWFSKNCDQAGGCS